jgi:hypothetical protein
MSSYAAIVSSSSFPWVYGLSRASFCLQQHHEKFNFNATLQGRSQRCEQQDKRMSNEDIPGMKNEGQLVTLPSIPTTSNAFAPLALQHPSTYFPTEFVF